MRLSVQQGTPSAIALAVAQAAAPAQLIRWAIASCDGSRLEVDATVWAGAPPAAWPAAAAAVLPSGSAEPFVVVQILPTGIGLETGGYAGDGTPATNLLAAAADHLVTHPNAVNAAGLNWAAPNVLYVEGGMLDAWLAGAIALRPVRANKVGVLVDRAIAASGGAQLVANAIGAFRTVGGARAIVAHTAEPLALTLETTPNGASTGSVGNPLALIAGARELVERGAEAIAVVADFSRVLAGSPAQAALPLPRTGSAEQAPSGERTRPDAVADPYLAGQGVDPIGGLEAILSRLVWHALGVPCAHAPFLPPSAEPCDPRAAAEELGGSFVPSILRGLHRAPRAIAPQEARSGDLLAPDLVVVPQGAVGGPGTLAAAGRGIPIVFVHNPGVLTVQAADLGLEGFSARSYLEAAGIALALRAGLTPECLG